MYAYVLAIDCTVHNMNMCMRNKGEKNKRYSSIKYKGTINFKGDCAWQSDCSCKIVFSILFDVL